MATIDVGKLTFTHKGDYSSSTAYVANDVVYYSTNGNAYIAKQSTTGNVPTNATYWNLFVLKGTDTSVLTTQGDVLYHNGSALARLGYGTAGLVLKTNGSGQNPSWGTVSSDYVKLGTATLSGTAATVSLDGLFDDTTYTSYDVHWKVGMTTNSSQNHLNLRFNESGSAYSGTQYTYGFMHHGNNNSGGFHDARGNWGNGSWGKQDSMELSNTWGEHQIRQYNMWNRGKLTIWEPQSTADYTQCVWTNSIGSDNSSWTAGGTGHGILHRTQAATGVTFKFRGGQDFIAGTKITMYGVK